MRSRKSYTAIVEIIRRNYALRPKKPRFLENRSLCTKYFAKNPVSDRALRPKKPGFSGNFWLYTKYFRKKPGFCLPTSQSYIHLVAFSINGSKNREIALLFPNFYPYGIILNKLRTGEVISRNRSKI